MILNLSNYIHSLLLENETVIIPGFGAFVSIYKPAEIRNNEIKPPSKEISFTQQIKNNDGLLVEIIARKAKISPINALKRIEKAREDMLYHLDKAETVVIENIGNLFYNENNEIQFIPFQKDNLLLDSFGLETISMEDSVEKSVEIESSENVVNEINEPLEVALIDTITDNADEVETESASKLITEEADSEVQQETVPEVEKETELAPETFKFPEFKPAPVQEKPEERKKIGWYWYLLILIPFIIGGYFVLNNKTKSERDEIISQQNIKIEQQEIKVETIAPTDSFQNDSVQNTETIVTRTVNPESVIPEETGKYYLVGGGFESEENLEKYMLQLKEKGIDCFKCGKKGKLFLVGIESFDSEAEAIKSLNEHFKSNPDWKLWIYKK